MFYVWCGWTAFAWTYQTVSRRVTEQTLRWYTGWTPRDKAWERKQIQSIVDAQKDYKVIELKEGENYF